MTNPDNERTIPEERLGGSEWAEFISGLDQLPDHAGDELGFWRAVDYLKAPLFDGITEEDG